VQTRGSDLSEILAIILAVTLADRRMAPRVKEALAGCQPAPQPLV